MKSLMNYTHEKQTALFEETGAFFAFSNEQFAEKQQQGETYLSFGAGGVVPKQHARKLVEGLKRINQEGIAQDLAENGIQAIIKRELANYECEYTGDIEDCVEALEDYGITRSEILEVYSYGGFV